MNSRSGCIRLFPKDIKTLFQVVAKGTPVRIIDQPYKVGWSDGKLYLSVFPEMSEDKKHVAMNLTPMVTEINAAEKAHQVDVNWQRAMAVAFQHNGIPQVISKS